MSYHWATAAEYHTLSSSPAGISLSTRADQSDPVWHGTARLIHELSPHQADLSRQTGPTSLRSDTYFPSLKTPGTGPIRSPTGTLQSANTLTVVDARVACMAWAEIRTMKADGDRVGECKEEGGGRRKRGGGGRREDEDRPISALKMMCWRYALRLF
ncbi:hypothetical protein EYF80_032068 [Liparis tanakae]|uniref:Uncharacterized protein n=1 Tax=Liparis tanakae TaxID=230148 RepID=A0A4Z2GWS1_9TELE|nr:hypothetical protein EYF80_032068 [Liparis tanakae]